MTEYKDMQISKIPGCAQKNDAGPCEGYRALLVEYINLETEKNRLRKENARPLVDAAEVAQLAREVPCARMFSVGQHCSGTPEVGVCISCRAAKAILALAGEKE